ncbi:MAG: HDOD domain-containing protein [Candidatus Accumulibacter sp.]|jgi:EAL and modified HD-GYP domain-containing signal transduction protein|nr:HDOD domain-containing protein [Accumulibacter sp.]
MSDNNHNAALLNRQPILDLNQDIVAYALSLRKPEDLTLTWANIDSPFPALICAAYAELGIHEALGENKAFLEIDFGFLHDDAIEALPADAVVLELPLGFEAPDEGTLRRLRVLRARHYSFALTNYTGFDERSQPLLNLIDVVSVDISDFDDETLVAIVESLAHLPLKLLAKGVDNQERMEFCRGAGFQFFQGYYFAYPETVKGQRLSPSRGSLTYLIDLTAHNVDTATIEDIIKHEPPLVVNLLRIANSSKFGNSERVTTLRAAIETLGQRQLQRWFQLLLMTPRGKTAINLAPLLQVAALRGRMMELIVALIHPGDREILDQSFLTGIISMMPAALGQPFSEIFKQIALEGNVIAALESHAGVLGAMLALVECFDSENIEGCDKYLAELSEFSGVELNRGTLNTCLTQALRWFGNNRAKNPH